MYICGDIIDKGESSIKLAKYIFSFPNIHCIIGNHEYISVELKREDVPFAYLDDFCLQKEYRSRGIGTKLLQLSEAYANENIRYASSR